MEDSRDYISRPVTRESHSDFSDQRQIHKMIASWDAARQKAKDAGYVEPKMDRLTLEGIMNGTINPGW